MLFLRLVLLVLLFSILPGGYSYADGKHERLKSAALRQLNLRMETANLFGKTMTDRDRREFKRLEGRSSRWDVDFLPGKYIMFLDVPYGDGRQEVLTTAVHRRYKKEPPLGVSFVLPKGFDREQGVVLAFAKKQGDKALFKEADASVADFNSCNGDDCSYSLSIYDNKGRDADMALKVLGNMMKYDYLAVAFMQNHELKVLNIPLSYYQDKYLELSEVPRMQKKKR